MRAVARVVASVLVFAASAWPQSPPRATEARVIQAIARDLGIDMHEPVSRWRIELPASALRIPDAARLFVAGVHAVPAAKAWLLRLECGSRVECLPFEVVLRVPGAASGAQFVPQESKRSATPADKLTTPLVRSGQKVRLAEELSGMRLSAPAVCLQAGSLGQKIRVRNVSSGRVVLARVRAAGQVAVEQ